MVELVEKMGLSDHVVFAGNVKNSDLPEIYNMADIVASVPKIEAFGLSITEAMRCGKPVIGSKVGGIPEQIKHKKNGYLVGVNDYKDTARKINKLLSSKKQREKMGANSLKMVKEFSPKKILSKHVKLYQDLLKEKSDLWRLRMMNPKNIDALVLDFDQTLTDTPGRIKKDVVTKIKSLKKSMVLATSRSFNYTKKLCSKYPFWSVIVSENGAAVYFPKTKKSVITDSTHMKKARELVRKSDLKTVIGKIIIRTKKENSKKLKKILKPVKSKLSFEKNIDEIIAMPKYVNKAKGVLIALEHINSEPEKSILFGDGENDISLFNVPGYKVAVSNARKKLKNIADEVTEKPKGQGVIEAIEKLKK